MVRRIQHRYFIYGISLRSDWALPYCEVDETPPCLATVEIQKAVGSLGVNKDSVLSKGDLPWVHRERLRDGSFYLCWQDLFEFRVSADGRSIIAHPLNETPWEVFHTYLLGVVLSFALILNGLEPLHATVVVREGLAVALLGDCGHGKSTLAAACLREGYQLLTDDLLIVRPAGDKFLAYPGAPRIKLFPEAARTLLGEAVRGVAMNQWTTKLIIPLNRQQYCRSAVALRALYVLRPPIARFRVKKARWRTMSPRSAVLALVVNTFNAHIKDPLRLSRQFDLVSNLATRIPVRSLTYPQDLDRVTDVVKMITRN
jgi:hypothetical protein